MIEGTIAFVTGAASGIGKTISRLFSQEGSTVVMLDLDKTETETAAEEYGHGKIINISSDSAFIPVEGECAYSTSKAGILAFTRVAALEFGGHNINCNAICPGAVETPLLKKAMEKNNWRIYFSYSWCSDEQVTQVKGR